MQDKIIVDLLKNDFNDINFLLSEYLSNNNEKKLRISLIEAKLETIQKEFDLLKENLIVNNNVNNDQILSSKQVRKAAKVSATTAAKPTAKPANKKVANLVNNKNLLKQESKVEKIIETVIEPEDIPSPEKVNKKPLFTEEKTTIVEPIAEPVETKPVKKEVIVEKKKLKVLHHNTSVKSDVNNNTNNNTNNETNNMLNDKHIVSENVLLADRIVKHKVDDIRSLIGINDKFLFLRELFDGNIDKYNNIIDRVNKSLSFPEAYNLISDIDSWDMDNSIVQDFINICKRKF